MPSDGCSEAASIPDSDSELKKVPLKTPEPTTITRAGKLYIHTKNNVDSIESLATVTPMIRGSHGHPGSSLRCRTNVVLSDCII